MLTKTLCSHVVSSILILGMLLAGCTAPALPAQPTASAPTATADSGAALMPSPTAGQPAPPTTTPEPSATPTDEPPSLDAPAPLSEAPGIGKTGWSPDESYLSYMTYTEDDLRRQPFGEGWMPPGPGTLHFLHLADGTACAYRQYTEQGSEFLAWWSWLPGGQVLGLDGQGRLVTLADPCQPQATALLPGLPEPFTSVHGASPDNTRLVTESSTGCWLVDTSRGEAFLIPLGCTPDLSFSTSQHFLGYNHADGPDYTTLIINSENGGLEYQIPWTFSGDGLGTLPGPIWLNDMQFIVLRSDQGPLLVTLGAEYSIQEVAPIFFDRPSSPDQYATGAASEAGGFHILLTEYLDGSSRIDLYHGESGTVETLPFAGANFFSDGGWLSLYDWLEDADSLPAGYWLRAADPPGAQALSVQPGDTSGLPAWSAGRGLLALPVEESIASQEALLRIQPVPAGTDPQHYRFAGYANLLPTWSPSGRSLVVIASGPTGGQALFVLAAIP